MGLPPAWPSLVLSLSVSSSALRQAHSTSTLKCTDLIADGDANLDYSGTTCTDTWPALQPLLRPTQSNLGWAWVARKLSKEFDSVKDAQEKLDEDPVPVVFGPDYISMYHDDAATNGSAFFLTDDHHTLASLDYSWDTIG